jgi:hypothetical protein
MYVSVEMGMTPPDVPLLEDTYSSLVGLRE